MRAAATTAGSTPRVDRSRPSRPSSPSSTTSSSRSAGTAPAAASTPTASATSNIDPRLGSVAGSSASVIRRVGQVSPEFTIAARIRSRASCSAASGRPIIVTPGSPSARSAWISTSCPSTPSTATDVVRASVIRTRPRRCRTSGSASGRRTTVTTSKRRSRQPMPCAASQRRPSRRIRADFAAVTASAGSPKPVPERVFTSQKTSVSPSSATMSSSPSAHRQLRSTIRSPAPARCRAATSSPKRPIAPLTRPTRPPLVGDERGRAGPGEPGRTAGLWTPFDAAFEGGVLGVVRLRGPYALGRRGGLGRAVERAHRRRRRPGTSPGAAGMSGCSGSGSGS